MVLPIELKNIIEDLALAYPQKVLKESANKLSDRYLNESGKGASLANKEVDILAYAVMRMPATFAAVSAVLEEVFKRTDEKIETVLDAGAGMGTATFASFFSGLRDASYTCVEKEKAMVDFGKKLFFYFPEIKVNYLEADYRKELPSGKFDLVIASYTLNELTDEDRKKVVDSLWEKTNKILIIVEPGTPVASMEVRTIRNHLIKYACIIGPCAHTNECPMSADDWCHFVTRTERSKLHKYLKGGDAPYEDEKYSYIALSKVEPINKIDYRVLRHPVIGKGNINLTVCSNNGIEEKRYFKSYDKFKELKKIKAGEGYKE